MRGASLFFVMDVIVAVDDRSMNNFSISLLGFVLEVNHQTCNRCQSQTQTQQDLFTLWCGRVQRRRVWALYNNVWMCHIVGSVLVTVTN